MILAPVRRQAELLLWEMHDEWNPRYVRIVTDPNQLRGMDLSKIEVWWLDGLWTMNWEGMRKRQEMKMMAKARGAGQFWKPRI